MSATRGSGNHPSLNAPDRNPIGNAELPTPIPAPRAGQSSPSDGLGGLAQCNASPSPKRMPLAAASRVRCAGLKPALDSVAALKLGP